MFFGPSGKVVKPDRAMIEAVQRYSMAALTGRANSDDTAGVERHIGGFVADLFLANALFIGWLIDTVRPDDVAHLTSINNRARSYYIRKMSQASSSGTRVESY